MSVFISKRYRQFFFGSVLLFASQSGMCLGWGDMLGGLFSGFDNILAAIVGLFAVFALVVAGAEMFFTLMFSDILITIGSCLGPLILALSITQWFRSMALQWVGFMLGATFTKVICAIIVSMMAGMFDKINAAGSFFGNPQTGWMSNTAAAIAAVMMAYIFSKTIGMIPGISSSLFGGISANIKAPMPKVSNKSGIPKGGDKGAGERTSTPKQDGPPPKQLGQ